MSLAIALVDMPMVFLIQWATFPTTPVPSAVAGYTMGIYVLLLVIEVAVAGPAKDLLHRRGGRVLGGAAAAPGGGGDGGDRLDGDRHGHRRRGVRLRQPAPVRAGGEGGRRTWASAGSAEEELRLRDEFLSVASHELKTPLTALQLEVEGLVRRVRLAGAQSDPGRLHPRPRWTAPTPRPNDWPG